MTAHPIWQRSHSRWLVLILLMHVGAPALGEDPPPPETEPPSAAKENEPLRSDKPEYVGETVCRACHQLEAKHWNDTVHAAVFHRQPQGSLASRTCEACHGPGSLHVAAGGDPSSLVAFTHGARAPVEKQNDACLACHAGGGRIHWVGSTHEKEGLSCSDCHNPMSRTSDSALLRMPNVNETCFTCHQAQRAEFHKRSHMPLLEGKLSCADCHQPHGSVTDPLLRADSVNHLCTNCHAEKRGPFLWEHAPVVESCLNCHLPHGSNHESLLTTSIPFLCQECHEQLGILNHPTALQSRANLPGGIRPDERIANRGCVNCHAQIHGSNHPSGARFHR